MTDGEERSPWFFYGLQPRWLSWDRFYRVYVSDKMLAGAYIAGQFYDQQSAALQLQQLGLLFRPLVRRCLAQRQQREALYDTLDPFGPSLLDHDPRNFQVLRSDVVRTRFRRNRSLWAPYNVGVVELELLDGTTRRFILVGDQEPDAVLRLIVGCSNRPASDPQNQKASEANGASSLPKTPQMTLIVGFTWGTLGDQQRYPDPDAALIEKQARARDWRNAEQPSFVTLARADESGTTSLKVFGTLGAREDGAFRAALFCFDAKTSGMTFTAETPLQSVDEGIQLLLSFRNDVEKVKRLVLQR